MLDNFKIQGGLIYVIISFLTGSCNPVMDNCLWKNAAVFCTESLKVNFQLATAAVACSMSSGLLARNHLKVSMFPAK